MTDSIGNLVSIHYGRIKVLKTVQHSEIVVILPWVELFPYFVMWTLFACSNFLKSEIQ